MQAGMQKIVINTGLTRLSTSVKEAHTLLPLAVKFQEYLSQTAFYLAKYIHVNVMFC